MRRTLLMALALTLLSLAVGWEIAAHSVPSSQEIQQYSLEELAKDNPPLARLLQQPFVKAIIDPIVEQAQDRVRDHVVDESRNGMLLALGAIFVINVGGVALIAVDHRRRTGHAIDAEPVEAQDGAAVG